MREKTKLRIMFYLCFALSIAVMKITDYLIIITIMGKRI